MSLHPLGQDLTGLSEDELQRKLADLSGKRIQAYRFGSYDLMEQLELLIFDVEQEIRNRNAENMRKLAEQSAKRGGDLDDLIDI